MENIDTLLAFARAETHKNVINLFEDGVDLSDFDVYHDKLWSLYVPKVILDYVPLLSFHSDVVFKVRPKEFMIDGDVITNADPKYGCGWDCRAGCYIAHELIKDQQNYMYLICDLEESGGIGSKAFANSEVFRSIVDKVSCFIGLDRKGTDDCASYGYDNDELFNLMEEYGGYQYAYGSFTDVVNLSDNSTLACCNLSVSYNNEHTCNESLSLEGLENTLVFLMEYLPQDLWSKQFFAETTPKMTWNSYNDEYLSEVVCDVCFEHAPLYNVGWGQVCKHCLPVDVQ
jgi:hypothetical protein